MNTILDNQSSPLSHSAPTKTSVPAIRGSWLAFVCGLLVGLVAYRLVAGLGDPAAPLAAAVRRPIVMTWPWVAFGFIAQGLFMSRMLVQWMASERARASVVPAAFWWLSLFGGTMLLTYFLRRGDPVGSIGQLTGVLVYSRNLVLLHTAAASRHQSASRDGPESSP